MLKDEELTWADSDSLEVWAPVHAWRILGQPQAIEAINPLLDILRESEEIPYVYGMIGEDAIPLGCD